MKIFHVFSRRTKYILSAATLVLTFIAPTLFTGFASAAQLTERSISLSSASAAATGVTYTVSFTGQSTAGAFVIELCSDSPVLGNTCEAPDGAVIDTAAIGTQDDGGDATATNKLTADEANAVEVTDSAITSGHTTTVDLTGVTNPTDAGALYARIVTFASEAAAKTYSSATAGPIAGAQDEGGVALSITNSLNVGGTVQESLTFCESGAPIATKTCSDATTPHLNLGTEVGTSGVYALGPTLSTVPLYTQISTNAVGGAVVSLKSDATGCGGLTNSSAGPSSSSNCYIKPASASAMAGGDALFGIKLGSETDNSGGETGHGTIEPVTGKGYNTSTYNLNFTSGATPASGVTSAYGDQVLDTAGAPADAQTIPITFGADASNLTPAGNYSANISLIATGTF